MKRVKTDIIHFAHANGFPAGTYDQIFKCLQKDFEIRFIERHAHDPKFPVSDGWVFLRDELISEIHRGFQYPIIGVGHSLGGILHLLAAAENPHLYKQIILLDAPIISRLSSRGLQFLKMAKLVDRYSPSQITRFRRNLWANREQAFEHFHQKPKFALFDERVLRDYIEHGTIRNDRGFSLFFDQHIEAEIYRTIPHTLPALRGKLSVPLVYIGGSSSREGRLSRLSFMKRNFPIEFHQIAGTHLFPFEKPEETADLIKLIASRTRQIN